MENEIVVCPACGSKVSSDKKFCTQCGYSFDKMREAQKVLETDHELVKLNEKYAKNKKAKRTWSIVLALSIAITYMWLEYNWFDNYLSFISTLALLCIPVSIVALIVSNIGTSRNRKKIEDGLEERVGNYHLDLDANGPQTETSSQNEID